MRSPRANNLTSGGRLDLHLSRSEIRELSYSNTIKRILGSCIVQENFVGNNSPQQHRSCWHERFGFDATSENGNRPGGHQGSYLDFTGEFKDSQMVLSREATPQMEPCDAAHGLEKYHVARIRLELGTSKDQGKTWEVLMANPLQAETLNR